MPLSLPTTPPPAPSRCLPEGNRTALQPLFPRPVALSILHPPPFSHPPPRAPLCPPPPPPSPGAAVQGAVLSGVRDSHMNSLILVDVCPLTLGIETEGRVFAKVVPRNTSVPCSKTRVCLPQPPLVPLHYQGSAGLCVDGKTVRRGVNPPTPRDVLERLYTVGGGGVPPPPPDPPHPLPMFEADSQNFASAPSVPRGFELQNFRPAFGGGHRGTPGGGGSQPTPPSPPQTPPPDRLFQYIPGVNPPPPSDPPPIVSSNTSLGSPPPPPQTPPKAQTGCGPVPEAS